MKYPLFKAMLVFFAMSLLSFGFGLLDKAKAGTPLKLYYEENAQIELISPEGLRVLIDVHDPSALSSPPTAKDVLLTTHNHGDHRRLDFVSSFPRVGCYRESHVSSPESKPVELQVKLLLELSHACFF